MNTPRCAKCGKVNKRLYTTNVPGICLCEDHFYDFPRLHASYMEDITPRYLRARAKQKKND